MKSNRQQLAADLRALGLQAGDLIMVHGSLRAIGPVVGGVNTVIRALFDVIGDEGTLTAYVDIEPFCDDDDDPDLIPVFDKRVAHAARDHGVLHETLRNWPGTIRSDHPDAGVVANGPLAGWFTSNHPFQYGYGDGSPLAKLVERKGRIVMLGAPLDTITLLHYAEHKAQIPNKTVRRYRRLMPGPEGPQWIDFEEFDTTEPVRADLPLDSFEQIGQAYLAAGFGASGLVGLAQSHLLEGPELVKFAVDWLERQPFSS